MQRRIIPKHSLDTAMEESRCSVHYQIRRYVRFKPVSRQKPKSFSYTTLAITSLEADEQIRANQGNILIGYPIKHTPAPDHKVLLEMDGELISADIVSGSHPLAEHSARHAPIGPGYEERRGKDHPWQRSD